MGEASAMLAKPVGVPLPIRGEIVRQSSSMSPCRRSCENVAGPPSKSSVRTPSERRWAKSPGKSTESFPKATTVARGESLAIFDRFASAVFEFVTMSGDVASSKNEELSEMSKELVTIMSKGAVALVELGFGIE